MNALRHKQIKSFMKDIHKDNDTSYITVANRDKTAWKQVHCLGHHEATTHIINLVNSDISDIYHSNNSFFKQKRGEATLFNLNALYIDIDCHDDSTDKVNYARVHEYLKVVYFNRKIPLPTYVICSGRGLHLYWKIETAPRQAAYLWKLLQTRIAEVLSDITDFESRLHVDMTCVKDVARVFRVPNTLNSKSQTYAQILEVNNVCYSMSDIRDTFYNDLYKNNDRLLSKSRKRNQNIIANRFFNKLNLQQSRIEDLLLLLEMRQGDMKGYRDKFLFIYAWTVVDKRASEEIFTRELFAVNELFKIPLIESKIRDKAKHIYKKYESKALKKDNPTEFYEYFDVYIFRNETIIKELNITEQEQKQLKTIIAKREKYDRNNERRQTERRNEAGMTKREQAKHDTMTRVRALKDKGLKQKQVASELGVGIATVKRYW
ncbi:MAG: hypothetical protein H9W82_03345 [Lactobacillus sp.]|nr:hypothetical protein [Lactobacillus sp.]